MGIQINGQTDTVTSTTAGGRVTVTPASFPSVNNINATGLSTFSGGIIVAAGTTSAPSISPTGDSNTGIFFPAADTVSIAEGGVEALRVDSSSNIGIGTTGTGDKLTVLGRVQIQQDSGSNNRLILRGQPGSLYRWNIDNNGSSNDFRIFREDDATTAGGAVYASLSSSGNLTLNNGNLVIGTAGKGIDFSATTNSSGTMTSELLDDYERGTWTATVVSGGSAITTNYASYIKVGNLVFVTGRVSGLTSPNGSALIIGGLPFTVKNNIESIGPAMVFNVTFPSSMTSPVSYFNYNTANVYLYYSGSGVTWASSTGTQFGTGGIWIISGCYEAA